MLCVGRVLLRARVRSGTSLNTVILLLGELHAISVRFLDLVWVQRPPLDTTSLLMAPRKW